MYQSHSTNQACVEAWLRLLEGPGNNRITNTVLEMWYALYSTEQFSNVFTGCREFVLSAFLVGLKTVTIHVGLQIRTLQVFIPFL